ncbi:MAG: hypothetical protein ABIT36_03805 [Steroidobacteraceae bacterium]
MDDDELGEWEQGFIDGWMRAKEIGVPSKEQLIEALNELEQYIELMENEEPKPN